MDVEEKIVNTHILRLPKRPMIESSDDKVSHGVPDRWVAVANGHRHGN